MPGAVPAWWARLGREHHEKLAPAILRVDPDRAPGVRRRSRLQEAKAGAAVLAGVPAWWARRPLGGRGAHLPGRHPGGWADVPRSGLSGTANQTIPSCRRPTGRSCAARVRSSPLLSKIAGSADDKRRMRGLRGRCAHIVEHASTHRDHIPADGTRVHPADTPARHPGTPSPGVASPARPKPDRRQATPRPSAQHPLPRPPTKPDAPTDRGETRRTHSKICDAEAGPCTHRDRAGEDPQPGEGVARRAAVETDQLRSPAQWLRNAPNTDTSP